MYTLPATLFLIFISYNAAAESDDDVEERYGFQDWFRPPPRQFCRTKNGQQGSCGPLNICPTLLAEVRNRNPSSASQILNQFSCGYGRSMVVCCPDSGRLQIDSNRGWDDSEPIWTDGTTTRRTTTSSWTWGEPQSSSVRPTWQPEESTTQGWNRPTTTATRRTTTYDGSNNSGGGQRTNHRNRRLLPESSCGVSLGQKIIGGENTALDEFPWMALIRLRFSSGRTAYICGGSLISKRYVLTAAHCLRGSSIPSGAVVDQVRLGEHDLNTQLDCMKGGGCSPPTDDIDIEERFIHQGYNPRDRSSLNDIALVRLRRDAKMSAYVQPICLPLDAYQNDDLTGKLMVTAGWGRTTNEPKSNSPFKLKVDLPVVSFTECNNNYTRQKIPLKDSQFCAGGLKGKDSCSGDSGGPLMTQEPLESEVRWFVFGIVSFGPKKCGEINSPAVYTKVGKYVNWILDNMKD